MMKRDEIPLDNIPDLKICPDCGSTRVVLKARAGYGTFYYVCKKCGYTPEKIGNSLVEAITIWNDRHAKKDG